MLSMKSLSLLATLSSTAVAETVLGVYIFSRHGDRTAKETPPTALTDLGYSEIFTSGSWFRSQYIANNATSQIAGIEPNVVKLSQLAVSAPLDNVLMSSATGFVQGLYPPVGSSLGSEQLRNGSTVQSPLNGYQIIPIAETTNGAGSESSVWLQGAGNCLNAETSSNEYFSSDEFSALLQSTQDFYDGLEPMINQTFTAAQTSFKNAYTIFDLLNVASIHNITFPSSQLLTAETFFQIRTLADNHEFNLAYNASSPVRAIAGATLGAQVVQALNATVSTQGDAPKLNIQFGAYNSFQSLFGLMNMTTLGPDWIGIPDYASSMTWELFTNGSADPFPSTDDLNVRFLFHNGTTNSSSTPAAYPMFGQSSTVLSWDDFTSGMNQFAIGDQASWCQACGNTTGVCAGTSNSSSTFSSPAGSSSNGGNGISTPVAGVIGAMVTLGVILGVEVLIALLFGLRVVKKRRAKTG